MKATLVLSAVICVLAACGGSGTVSPPGEVVIGEHVFGPAGDTWTVSAGPLAGLSLQVPAGAVAAPQRVRLIQLGFLVSSLHDVIGPMLRFEPVDLAFMQPAVLQVPYQAAHLTTLAPGNVRLSHVGPAGERLLRPFEVDVAGGLSRFEIPALGGFSLVAGPRATLQDYLPGDGEPVTFDSGASFVSEVVLDEPNLAGPVTRWSFSGDDGEAGLYLDGGSAVPNVSGRFDRGGAGWQELWRSSVPLFVAPLPGQLPAFLPGVIFTDVYAPFGSTVASGTGRATFETFWQWREPLQVGSQLLLDVLELQWHATWQRDDIGAGSSDLVLWMAPGLGVLGMRRDGVVHLRTGL